MRKLEAPELAALAAEFPAWQVDTQAGTLSRSFAFADFMQAFAFMTHVAIAAEKHNHHPEWSNVYNRVSITWTTHDVRGLSTNDSFMARMCEQVYAGCAGRSPA